MNKLNKQSLNHLLNQISLTTEDEIGCDDCFDQIDVFAEAYFKADQQALALMPKVKQHLELCPDCDEEFRALLEVLEASES